MSELKAGVPKCTLESIGMKITGKDAPPIIAACNEYLSIFADTDGKCPNCDRTLGGLLGTFTWGICSGEGTCAGCGWPCRAHHDIKDAAGEAIFDRMLQCVLPYHPSGVKNAAPEDED